MSVQNSIAKKQQSGSFEVTYESNGEKVKLTPQMVKDYLVSGGGIVSDQEIIMFLSMCKFQHLNPFLREAYLIKYSDKNPATMVVGKDTFLKRARRQSDFKGLQAGIIVRTSDSELIEREGTCYDKSTETIIGGWAKVFIDGYEQPFFASVSMDEYIGRKGNGEVNGQWSSKPATMIRKVALSQALREAFPEETLGLYEPEELGLEEPAPNPDLNALDLKSDSVPEPQEVVNSEESPMDDAEATETNPVIETLFEI